MTQESYRLVEGGRGLRLEVLGHWTDALESTARQEGVVELELNYAKGWTRGPLDFLASLKFLRTLVIVDWGLQDVSIVEMLDGLEELHLSVEAKRGPNLARLSSLKQLSVEWAPWAQSMFELRSLVDVFLNHYPGNTLDMFTVFTNLKRIELASPANLERIGNVATLEHLRMLGIYRAPKLASLEGIEVLAKIQEIAIETCRKIDSLDPLRALGDMRRIDVSNLGEIESLEPLSKLAKLEEVVFVESTNVRDGRISVLESLPELKRTSFQNRRHYDRKREELPAP